MCYFWKLGKMRLSALLNGISRGVGDVSFSGAKWRLVHGTSRGAVFNEHMKRVVVYIHSL